MRPRYLLLALIGGPGIAFAQQPAPFTIAESGQSFARLADAVRVIGDGDGTIRIAPGRYTECAVQEGGRVAFVGAGSGSVTFDGAICEGKATLVLRGRAAHVRGITFIHTVVPDGNGAGIRLEKGDLKVEYSRFLDGQCGILTASDPAGTITIDHASFSGLGKHPDGSGAHALYVGKYGRLVVTNTRFERGTGGHYLKSRAASIQVVGNSFDDSHGSATNYLIDLSEGARGEIANNVFVNGTGKENHSAMIAVAPEARNNPSAGLVIRNNRASVVPDFRWSTVFVGDWSHEGLVLRDNKVAAGIKLVEQR